jgi:hypothetical protein
MRCFSANKDIEFWLTQAKKLIFRILEYMHAKLRKNMKMSVYTNFGPNLKISKILIFSLGKVGTGEDLTLLSLQVPTVQICKDDVQ